MSVEMQIDEDVEVVNSQGLRNSLVQFWIGKWEFKIDEKRSYYKLSMDPNKLFIVGCDEEERRKLLRYRTHFASCTITLHPGPSDIDKGVIERVYENTSAEMSPNISYYSEDEYPQRDFAITCGIRASFCFPLFRHCNHSDSPNGVMEIVSTCSQDVGTLEAFCKSLKLEEYAIPELGRLLEALCRRFHLPLTQYWTYDGDNYCLLRQFSDRDFENLRPWCQFKDACLHRHFDCLLGNSYRSHGAFFCRDISALSITKYPLAHYARDCGSIPCFTIYLNIISAIDEEYSLCALEFFLPFQEMDNDHTQTLLSSIWATLRESLPNCKLACKFPTGEELPQVLSVEIINSSTQTELESFEIGHPQCSLLHYDGLGLTRTLKLFEKGPDQSSNSNSSEEAATGEKLKRIPNDVSPPRRPEEYFKTKGNTMAAERDEQVEGSILEEAPYATTNVDIRNAMTSASQPSRFQTKKTLCQQQQETMFLKNDGDTSQQLHPILQPLFEDGTKQGEQVLEIIKSTQNTYSYEEISTDAASKRAAECVEQIISLDELEAKLPEPQCLTSQLIRPDEIFGDEGCVASLTVDNLVEVSPDKDVKYAATIASRRLKKSNIPCTVENIRKHFGRPLKDAAESFGVSVSTFKRRFRDVGITWWQPGKSQREAEPGAKIFSPGMSNLPNRHVFTHASRVFNTVTVKVRHNTLTIRFELPSSSGIAELEDSVIERLHLDRKSFSLKYQDDEDDWINITCDEDVRECMKVSRSFKKPTIKMKLGPPINSYPG